MTEVVRSSTARPPDWLARQRALRPDASFLVQAPAGSGKTYLLTQRFLRLLGQAERPEEIVAITFTKVAAAEMRNRVLEALEGAELRYPDSLPDLKSETEGTPVDPESLEALAEAALAHSKRMGWQILELPGQLRITTIDAFCRGLALQSPLSWGLLSGLGGTLPVDEPKEAYRRAARRTLELLEGEEDRNPARESVEALLRWRDNNWQDIENLIVQMVKNRSRWFRDFVFDREIDEQLLRARLEQPLVNAFACPLHEALECLTEFSRKHDSKIERLIQLAAYAHQQTGGKRWRSMEAVAKFPNNLPDEELYPNFRNYLDELEKVRIAFLPLADFLLTSSNTIRVRWTVTEGFPPGPKFPKARPGEVVRQMERYPSATTAYKDELIDLISELVAIPGFESSLAGVRTIPPTRYTEEDWTIIRHCFAVLRTAAAELQLVFAESGSVDFTEVARIALNVLAPEGGFASDFAQRQADAIRHLLVDEFQDTSRQQHELLSRIVAAWPEREGRSCFCVGDPMQSIYGFRDAEVELFERLKTHGLETASDQDSEPFLFDFVRLEANFRTVPSLVEDLNGRFERVFGEDGEPTSGAGPEPGAVRFAPAIAAREAVSAARAELHLAFTRSGAEDVGAPEGSSPDETRETQLREMVELIGEKLAAARDRGDARYRVAVLARTRKSLIPIAEALREAGIGFRAIDLEKLNERPEVVDALALARALMNPMDRTAWLAVLRAPWCGLSLAELHLLTSADDEKVSTAAIPELLERRLAALAGELGARAFAAAERVGRVLRLAQMGRAAAIGTLGTWLESVWKALGGADTVDRAQAENLRVLWAALDKLAEGELDLLGPGLEAALDGLYALPEPEASGEFGVQLMTIHKSKGLEFEAVLVPDLEAQSKQSEHGLMSWLERGLPGRIGEPGPEGEISEFLIAPIKTKGGEASAAKAWVDGVKKERDRLELRRLFYVAATRAREELHLFARPRFGLKKGEAVLAKLAGLLQTAWPAFGEEIERRFADWWSGAQAPAKKVGLQVETLAAGAGDSEGISDGNLLRMPASILSAPGPSLLRRLPVGYAEPEYAFGGSAGDGVGDGAGGAAAVYTRTQGGMEARLLGTAIHELLERYCRLRAGLEPAEALGALNGELPATLAGLRSGGLSRTAAERLSAEALAAVKRAAAHPDGAWILSPHAQAQSEARWTGFAKPGAKQLAGLRPDRVFFAARPHEDAPCWWIIDYKSADASEMDDEAAVLAFLREHRARYAGQLEAYAQVLRGLYPAETLRIRAAVFYPRLPRLDDWEC